MQTIECVMKFVFVILTIAEVGCYIFAAIRRDEESNLGINFKILFIVVFTITFITLLVLLRIYHGYEF